LARAIAASLATLPGSSQVGGDANDWLLAHLPEEDALDPLAELVFREEVARADEGLEAEREDDLVVLDDQGEALRMLGQPVFVDRRAARRLASGA
jgi:hypothetical protein